MPSFVVRVWLPDRPGALGAVASRIGAVRGDLVGIDILERGAGLAIDELVVELPDAALVPLLVQEVGEVDGVAVEDVRPVGATGRPDPRLAALETAAVLVAAPTATTLLDVLVREAERDFDAAWVAVIDDGGALLATTGDTPPTVWLSAFVAGGRSSARVASGDTGPDDVAWVDIPACAGALVVGRPGRPLRARERKQVAALARIADARWSELARRGSLTAHPSAG